MESEGNAGYLAKTVRLIWPATREFSPAAFYRLRNRAGREDYRREKKLFESRKQTVEKYIGAYLAGEYDGLRKNRARASGAGRPTEHRELKEVLYEYFLYVSRNLGGRVGLNLLRAKLTALIVANKENYGASLDEGGRINHKWLNQFLRRFLREYDLSLRKKNYAVKCSAKETEKRLAAYWKFVIRARAHFPPGNIQFDGYDHAPMYRRENAGKVAAAIGTGYLGAIEGNSGDRSRAILLYCCPAATARPSAQRLRSRPKAPPASEALSGTGFPAMSLCVFRPPLPTTRRPRNKC